MTYNEAHHFAARAAAIAAALADLLAKLVLWEEAGRELFDAAKHLEKDLELVAMASGKEG